MTRRPCTFRESDLKRALRAAQAAGVSVKIEIEADGKMTVTMDSNKRAFGRAANENEWDEIFNGDDQA
jgi:hypothetical protein